MLAIDSARYLLKPIFIFKNLNYRYRKISRESDD